MLPPRPRRPAAFPQPHGRSVPSSAGAMGVGSSRAATGRGVAAACACQAAANTSPRRASRAGTTTSHGSRSAWAAAAAARASELQRGDANQLDPAGARQRARCCDPDPQAGEGPGSDPDGDPVDLLPAPAGARPGARRPAPSAESCGAGRCPGRGSSRACEFQPGLGVGQRHRGGPGGRIEAKDPHSTLTSRLSPPACSSTTRAAIRAKPAIVSSPPLRPFHERDRVGPQIIRQQVGILARPGPAPGRDRCATPAPAPGSADRW